ncbi:hypothetical protein D3C75_1224830 [compost metagenome]
MPLSQAIGTTLGQLPFLQTISATFSDLILLEALRPVGGQLSFLDAVGGAFGDVMCSGAAAGRSGTGFSSVYRRNTETEG